jgi:hypothetical protein
MLPTKFRLIWPSGFREDLNKSANQKQELPVKERTVIRKMTLAIISLRN